MFIEGGVWVVVVAVEGDATVGHFYLDAVYMNAVVAALMGVLHLLEHIAPLVVDICYLCDHTGLDKNVFCERDNNG